MEIHFRDRRRTPSTDTMHSIMTDPRQTGKTQWVHYQLAYSFVWILKYQRRIHSGEVNAACKALLAKY
ncbi:hypothetical protein MFUM_500001 [Methylacidiphilum fumariolicum SolV]|uniref:Uncharacterized protein n=2 Tax=Candidatus Methylacidiphilum fumarolicum TaxID=591154 RepID=I0JYB4_METFB|nr:hypothetical protein MFUM_500001 [Methylacidiphilum fumariolicum SolV]